MHTSIVALRMRIKCVIRKKFFFEVRGYRFLNLFNRYRQEIHMYYIGLVLVLPIFH